MLTKNAHEMLWRVALAEHFTSPTEPCEIPQLERARLLEELRRGGLINGSPQRITEAGISFLDPEQRTMYERMKARRDGHVPRATDVAIEQLCIARRALDAACAALSPVRDREIRARGREIAELSNRTIAVRDRLDGDAHVLASSTPPNASNTKVRS